ncbi:MAG: SDR family NAD(P)-dependent oxidoreductase [Candidatus Heimdallarchaeaceae archaeon]
MKNNAQLMRELRFKYPIWGYSPQGVNNPELAIKLSKFGGVGLIDLGSLNEEKGKNIIEKCKSNLSNYLWGLRFTSISQLSWVQEDSLVPICIIAFEPDEITIRKLKKKCQWIVAEVCYLDEAKEKSSWADFFLVKGIESGGKVGEHTSFILIQQFYESGYPYVIQGGFGIYNVLPALIGGALAVVLEGQLYQLPECPLSEEKKNFLSTLEENDTYILGESFPYKYRLGGKLANKKIRELRKKEKTELIVSDYHKLFEEVEKLVEKSEFCNESDLKNALLPLDVGVCFGREIKERFGDLKSYLVGLSKIIEKQIINVNKNWPFKEKNEFAQAFSITYPIIQGPMANVSDRAEFAIAVAKKGALPIFALGGLTIEETEQLFTQIKEHVSSNVNYGCGIIGLNVMKERREAHIRLMRENNVPICLLAASTIQLAVRVKKLGFKSLMHTPALSLFQEALHNEIDACILEGNECGGHIGVLSSFVLWEKVLQYLYHIKDSIKSKIKVIFAGGISSDLASAMVAGMIGEHLNLISPAIQMGTAYLFTDEIVQTGALSAFYQEKILDSFVTKVIGSTVNTRARTIPTPFVERTLQSERKRVFEGLSINERKKLYELDNLGALRIATKAEIWNDKHVQGDKTTSQFLPVTKKQQEKKGCFMAGDVISFKRNIFRIQDLHYDIVEGARRVALNNSKMLRENYLEKDTELKTEQKTLPSSDLESRIAIVGLGCIFPDANNIQEFWNNILNKHYSITEVPKKRWDPKLYYDPDKSALNKTYSKIGAFVKNYSFNPIEYRIPPTIAEKMDDVQKWSLDAAKQALQDAGLPTDGKKRLPIAIIVGNAIGGENQRLSNRSIFLPEFLEEVKTTNFFKGLGLREKEEFLEELKKEHLAKYPIITEDTMPGELSNIIAGRIANVFNLTGKSMSTDAACASSVAAIDIAVKSLITREFDIVLVGGADRSMDITSYVKFSKIRALSGIKSRPFDARADGFVMGEGGGFMVLKRLEDAINDKDKIYAVISSIGSSSDGRGKGITAPNPEGQKQAIQMALKKASLRSEDIQYIEAHGTSTIVGDATELKVLEEVFKGKSTNSRLVVGSIKSQIGHLKSAAGIASTIKAALSLYNKVLPPTVNVEELNPNIDWRTSPLYVNTEVKEWKIGKNEIRRAGVSAFGFGGTNYHMILEEYIPPNKEGEVILSSHGSYEKESISTIPHSVFRDDKQEQICFMFTGQGSQYLGMLKDLYNSSEIVAKTLDKAENIWYNFCSISLKDIIFGSKNLSEKANKDRLRDTKFTQPALFVVDIALARYLEEKGIKPGLVAGHSLGEYAALVISGVLSFEDGLKAVITRGKAMNMAGKREAGGMAAVFASSQKVQELVNKISGHYLVLANHNSTNQTVVSGEIEGIKQLIELANKEKIVARELNVSTAFHSRIVKSVEGEMKRILDKLTFNPPKIPVYCNVTGKVHSSNPEEIREQMLKQVSSPVYWVDIVKDMYAKGGRLFIEVGPKRALSSFAKEILNDKEGIEIFTTLNPKENEIEKLNNLVQSILTIENQESKGVIQVRQDPQQEAFSQIQKSKPVARNIDFQSFLQDKSPELQQFLIKGYEFYSPFFKEKNPDRKTLMIESTKPISIGITGVGIGFPGKTKKVFDDYNINQLLKGENFINEIDERTKKEILDKNIVRLVKTADGNVSFVEINDVSKVIQLAGQIGEFKPKEDFKLNPKLLDALDVTFQLAICAGLEALKDAGIPLIKSTKKTSTGKVLEGDWVLPEDMQDETGIIFASAFPGYDNLVKELNEYWKSGKEKQFPRSFLFRILSMGHAQFAQLIKAKGPNTQINAACASTTQAIGIAEDWIKTGRCERVIVIAADDASSENLLPWIGGGFLVAGGVTTKSKVEEAALPFGKDRHGLIIGSAAAGLVIESEKAYTKRGVKPLVDIIGTKFVNSAYHGSRLDAKHISKVFSSFIEDIERKFKISRKELVEEGMFVSHETYTPARGGSAEAEIESLRSVFGKEASKIVIVNTKGFTGHAMGAGIEECVAIKAMEKGIVPPIANIEKIDPLFKDLNFSKGINKRLKYAIRLAAGFGSQIAFVALRLNSFERRFESQQYENWLKSLGSRQEKLFHDGRVLKLETNTFTKPEETTYNLASQQPEMSSSNILTEIIQIISDKTGYEPSLIEAEMHLEEDLGIDTVKQAEMFGLIREKWGLSFDDDVSLVDFTTPKKIAEYILSRISMQKELFSPIDRKEEEQSILDEVIQIISEKTGYEPSLIEAEMHLEEDLGIDTVKQAEMFALVREKWGLSFDDDVSLVDFTTPKKISEYITKNVEQEKPVVEPITGKPTVEADSLELKVLNIISKTTGYDSELIDKEMDLEEDLGIDTIKQAEIFGKLREEYNIPFDENISLAEFRTIKDIVKYLSKNVKGIDAEEPTKEVLPKEKEKKIEEKQQVKVEKLFPLPVPLEGEQTEKITLNECNNLIIDVESKITGKLKKELTKMGVNFGIIPLLNQKTPMKLGGFDNLIVTLPSFEKSEKFEVLTIYEKLFLLFQDIELNSNQRFVVLSSEEMFGFEKKASPLSAAISGFIKTLGLEYEAKYKHVYTTDVQKIILELENWDKFIEIAYNNSVRYSLVLSDCTERINETFAKNLTLSDLLLVTGGGRGITFKCLETLCEVEKPQIAIFGIEDISEYTLDHLSYTGEQLDLKKQELVRTLKEKGEKVTPVLIERRWNQFLFGLEVFKNIRSLKEKGLKVQYYKVDITKKGEVEKAIRKVEKDFESQITHIIHGAGLEESKQFKKKKVEFSKLIVSVKVDGIKNILSLIDTNKLKRVVCFSSIAGRFGNRGQVDYSFANGFMSRLCWSLEQQGISSLACDWSAWGGVGMATRGSIMEILESQGIYPIPLEKGVEIFNLLFNNTFGTEVIVSCGLGPFDEFREYQGELNSHKFPMIQKIHWMGSAFRGIYPLSTENNNFMNDHRIQNTPVLPGVMGLEMFGELYSLISRKIPRCFKNVEFNSAVKLAENEPKEILVEYSPGNQELALKSIFIPKIKQLQKKEKLHFKAIVSFSESKRRKRKKQSIIVPLVGLLNREEIYSLFFHGKSFQILDKLLELKEEKAITRIVLPKKKLFKEKEKKPIIQPLLIEAALQTAGLYDLILKGNLSLPSKIEEVSILSDDIPHFVIASFISSDKMFSRYNIDLLNKDGTTVIQLKHLDLIHTNFSLPISQEMETKLSLIKEYWTISSSLSELQHKIIPLPLLHSKFLKEQESLIHILSTSEREKYRNISNNKRREEYLSGIIAAKELLANIKQNEKEKTNVEIRKTAKGQPYIYNLKDEKKSQYNISISHSGDFSIAVIDKNPLGIDIEKIEEREKVFFKEAFTAKERQVISYDAKLGTTYWTLKEAITKALGEGLHVKLHDIELSYVSENNYKVQFLRKPSGKETPPSNQIELKTESFPNYVISICKIKKRG